MSGKDVEKEELEAISHAMKYYLVGKEMHDKEAAASLKTALARIAAGENRERMRRIRRWGWAAVAAASVAVIVTAGIAAFTSHGSRPDELLSWTNDSNSAMNINLPDGTQTWLNLGSAISIGRGFNKEERTVSLSGEAYFDVVHDADRPFIVSANRFRVKVLGTVFSVKAFEGDRFSEVSLAQGSVAIQNAEGVNIVKIKPGQQAIYDAEDPIIQVKNVYVGDMLKRHYGVVSLKKATVREIIEVVTKVYDMDIEASSPDDMSTYNFSFSVNSTAEEVLSILNFTCRNQEFKIRDRQPDTP